MTDVDLCVNCYERTYRSVLAPGFFPALVADHGRRFARRTAIVNNVEDRDDAKRLAQRLKDAGELDAWFFVEDHIGRALAVTGVRAADIARAPYFTDWGLVLGTIPGPDWVVHCDSEVRMQEAHDWITPSIELMQRDPRVMAANPRWYAPTPRIDTLARSTLEWTDEFSLGLGFSDQLFLCRRAEIAAPIYGQRCVATRRYPMANVSRSFEARVDAWMRHHDRLRANYLGATYVHPDEIGGGYPARSAREKITSLFNRTVIAAVRRSPVKRRCCRAL
ncbi:MAG TPA: hypothetical protein VHY83_12415 [Solirubrobacteraceae bacterium]|jgi:hypothetical protein|nr:hypothetical protein [Solirubrobacteraceae bacterium]